MQGLALNVIKVVAILHVLLVVIKLELRILQLVAIFIFKVVGFVIAQAHPVDLIDQVLLNLISLDEKILDAAVVIIIGLGIGVVVLIDEFTVGQLKVF